MRQAPALRRPASAPPLSRRGGVRSRLTPRAVALAALVVALLLYAVVPFRTYLAQRERLERLERRTQVLEQQNERLRDEVRRLRDPDHVERIARCMGMVRPGEIAFVVVPEGTRPRAADC